MGHDNEAERGHVLEVKYARELVVCAEDAQSARERALQLEVLRLKDKTEQQAQEIEGLKTLNGRLDSPNKTLQPEKQPSESPPRPVPGVLKSFMRATASSQAKTKTSSSPLQHRRTSSTSTQRDDRGRLAPSNITAGYAKLTQSRIEKLSEGARAKAHERQREDESDWSDESVQWGPLPPVPLEQDDGWGIPTENLRCDGNEEHNDSGQLMQPEPLPPIPLEQDDRWRSQTENQRCDCDYITAAVDEYYSKKPELEPLDARSRLDDVAFYSTPASHATIPAKVQSRLLKKALGLAQDVVWIRLDQDFPDIRRKHYPQGPCEVLFGGLDMAPVRRSEMP